MFSSPFSSAPVTSIDPEAQVIFVSDIFVEDYTGGAELTTQALIDASPLRVQKLHSRSVTMQLLEAGRDKHWIFGNWAMLNPELIPTIVANLSYSVVEYDYKYCRYRSPQKHEAETGSPCDCQEQMHGKLTSAFYYGAKSLWWMSERQQEHYHSLFPFLDKVPNQVLSSVFDDRFFVTVKALRSQHCTPESQEDRKGWLVLGSDSWVKGREAALKHCQEHGLEHEVVWNLPYDQMLERLARAKGLVYLPSGWDTCPRLVIEAKLLGCELVLNENVQHRDEEWFATDDTLTTESYLYAARDTFWNGIRHAMEWRPTISGYTTTKDCIKAQYPWRESIQSMLGFCDEVVVVDGGSTDGTLEELREWAGTETKLKVHLVERDWAHPRFAVFDGAQKAEARKRCTGDFLWQMDADEVVPERDWPKVLELCRTFPREIDLISLPVTEFWGGPSKVRVDVNPWKWRLSRNAPHITHGIPKPLRRSDAEGHLYASPGTDGCDYVHAETGDVIPHGSFYTGEVHGARMAALSGNGGALTAYTDWFRRVTEALPGVLHYSWYDIPRKIRTYRDYWSQHWQSLYDIRQEDTAENNMFFDKPWSEVTEEEIEEMGKRLAEELGGHVFHSKVDWSRPTPWIVWSEESK
jgi:glycosyltransferase involved in cell wall biosynthesis